jgi:hypothetical protein
MFAILPPAQAPNKYTEQANNGRVTRTQKHKFLYSPHMNRMSVDVNIVRSVVCGSEVGITLFCMLWTDGIINGCWGSCTQTHRIIKNATGTEHRISLTDTFN